MIPKFPEFKKIELSDREEIERFTLKYDPYSDFDFESLWSWDVEGKYEFCELNGNLVVKLAEHFSNKPIYSFLGDINVNENLIKVFEKIKSEPDSEPSLKLVPEVVLKNIDFSKFIIEIDLNNYDYIYDNHHISSYEGPKYAQKRKLYHRFSRNFPTKKVDILNLKDYNTQQKILKLSKIWAQNKSEDEDDLNLDKEFKAIERFLQAEFDDVLCVGLFVENVLIGYQLFTLLPNKYAICHFGKTDISFHGAFEYMMSESSTILLKHGIVYLNTEEDLGLPHLRYTKNSYRPISFLRKYTIRQF